MDQNISTEIFVKIRAILNTELNHCPILFLSTGTQMYVFSWLWSLTYIQLYFKTKKNYVTSKNFLLHITLIGRDKQRLVIIPSIHNYLHFKPYYLKVLTQFLAMLMFAIH